MSDTAEYVVEKFQVDKACFKHGDPATGVDCQCAVVPWEFLRLFLRAPTQDVRTRGNVVPPAADGRLRFSATHETRYSRSMLSLRSMRFEKLQPATLSQTLKRKFVMPEKWNKWRAIFSARGENEFVF